MYPRAFDYMAASSLDQASQALSETPGAKLLSGGMSLLPMMKLRILSPSMVVDLGKVPGLDEVGVEEDSLVIGALVRHRRIAADDAIAQHAHALRQAAAGLGDTQVRNRGTLCGSLAHADPVADEPAAVLALGGILEARSLRGIRRIPAEEFFIDAFTANLSGDEIVQAVRIPLSGRGEGSSYQKLGRQGSHSYPVVASAAWLRIEEGLVTQARVALTGLSTRPILALGVAETLLGTDASSSAIGAAVQKSTDGIVVLEDQYGSIAYKRHIAELLTTRALHEAARLAR